MSLVFKTKGEVLNYAAKALPNVPTGAISLQIPNEPPPPQSRQYLQVSFDAIQAEKLVGEYKKAKAKNDQDQIRAAVNEANARSGAYETAIKDFLAYGGYNDKLYAAVISAYNDYNNVSADGKTFSQRTYELIGGLVADMQRWMPDARIPSDVKKLKDLPAPTAIGTDSRLALKVETMKSKFETVKVNLYLKVVDMMRDIELWLGKPAAERTKTFAAKRNEWVTRLDGLISDWNEIVSDLKKLNAIGLGVNTRVVVSG